MSSKLIAWILVLGLAQEIVVKASNCNNCINCCNCVSGEMQVEEQSRGIIRVLELSTGDVIRGITGSDRTPAWCKVQAINPTINSDNVTSFDGFTENHMVVENGTVRPYGKKGKVSKSRVYTLATECDAAINVEGQAFTPISTTFCPPWAWLERVPATNGCNTSRDPTHRVLLVLSRCFPRQQDC